MHEEKVRKKMHEEKGHQISTILFQTNFIYTLKHYLQKQKREIEILSRALASLYKKNMKSKELDRRSFSDQIAIGDQIMI